MGVEFLIQKVEKAGDDGWLKENRHIGARYDKPAASFMAFVTLAFIRRYLRLLHPSDTP